MFRLHNSYAKRTHDNIQSDTLALIDSSLSSIINPNICIGQNQVQHGNGAGYECTSIASQVGKVLTINSSGKLDYSAGAIGPNQVLSYDGLSTLGYGTSTSSQNRVLLSSSSGLPKWSSNSPSTQDECLCYNGTDIVWTVPRTVSSICKGKNQVTIGTGLTVPNDTTCVQPSSGGPGNEVLVFPGGTSNLNFTGSTSGSTILVSNVSGVPTWISPPTVANQCLCYNGTSITWRDSPLICTNKNEVTVGTGLSAPNNVTCVTPVGSNGGQMLSLNGNSGDLQFTTGAVNTNQVLLYNATSGLPTWLSAVPNTANQCLCYNGANLIWKNIPEVFTTDNSLTIGTGNSSPNDTEALTPAGGAGHVLTTNSSGDLVFTNQAISDNQVLYYNNSSGKPDWTGSPNSAGEYLCYNGSNIVWSSIAGSCTGANQLTVGTGTGISCLNGPTTTGQLLSFNGTNLFYSNGYSGSNRVLLSVDTTVPNWSVAPSVTNTYLCYNGTNVVWNNPTQPCTGFNEITVGNGSGIDCVSPSTTSGGELFYYSSSAGSMDFSSAAPGDNSIVFYDTGTQKVTWSPAPSTPSTYLCFDGSNLVWSGVGGSGPALCTGGGDLTMGDGVGGVTCLSPGTSGFVLTSNGAGSALTWTSVGGGSTPCIASNSITVGDGSSIVCVQPATGPAPNTQLLYFSGTTTDGSGMAFTSAGGSGQILVSADPPVWSGVPTGSGAQYLCIDGTDPSTVEWQELSLACTGLNELTRGTGTGTDCIQLSDSNGNQVLSYNFNTSEIEFTSGTTANNAVLLSVTNNKPQWGPGSTTAGEYLCIDGGGNVIWKSILQPCTGTNQVTYGNGTTTSVNCTSSSSNPGRILAIDSGGSLNYTANPSADNQIMYFDSGSSSLMWTGSPPAGGNQYLCQNGAGNLVWSFIAGVCETDLGLTVGKGSGVLSTCVTPDVFENGNQVLVYSGMGASNLTYTSSSTGTTNLFLSDNSGIPSWLPGPTGVVDVDKCLCYNGTNLIWTIPETVKAICTGANEVTVGTGTGTDCVSPNGGNGGQFLVYDGTAQTDNLVFSSGATADNQMLFYNSSLGTPSWTVAPPGGSTTHLAYNGSTFIWESSITPCTGVNQVAIGNGSGVDCVGPTGSNPDQYLCFDGTNILYSEIELNNLKSVSVTGPINGEVLVFNGTTWVNGHPGNGSVKPLNFNDSGKPYVEFSNSVYETTIDKTRAIWSFEGTSSGGSISNFSIVGSSDNLSSTMDWKIDILTFSGTTPVFTPLFVGTPVVTSSNTILANVKGGSLVGTVPVGSVLLALRTKSGGTGPKHRIAHLDMFS